MKKVKNSPFLLDDWTGQSLEDGWNIIAKLAKEKYNLDWYNPNFEVVNFEDMLHIYTGSLPVMYSHWSFGRQYIELHKQYLADRMGTAYEVVFNTNPSLCYLLEHNSPTMQALVQCHASVGHSSFFKNNIYFKEHTNANSIMPFLKNMKIFIGECEHQHGAKEVESLLDMCHALSLYAIDRRPIRNKTNKEKEAVRLERSLNKDRDYDLTQQLGDKTTKSAPGSGRLREENILKFIGKFSPALKQWQRDIISIYCKIQQYLYPQMLTKLMNEGFASFWHHTLMTDLGDLGYLEAGQSIEFLHSHCSVLKQHDFDSKYYNGVNPYKLGFEMFKDIRRICENPTEEDKEWFPGLIGKNWIEEVKFAAYNFKDESFIGQYLSPKLMRDLKLFVLNDSCDNNEYEITHIHDDDGYKEIRSKLSKQYLFGNHIPDIYVEGWDFKKRRTLYLVIQEHNGVEIKDDDTGACKSEAVMDMIKKYWPFPVHIKYIKTDGEEIPFAE